MLDINGIVEKMRAEGFEVTAEDVADVHRGLKNGQAYAGSVDREVVRLLRRHLAEAMSDGQVENAGY